MQLPFLIAHAILSRRLVCRSAVRWHLVSSVPKLVYATVSNKARNSIDRVVWEPCNSSAVLCQECSTSVGRASYMPYAGFFSLAGIYGGWRASGGNWHTTSRFTSWYCPWRKAVLRSNVEKIPTFAGWHLATHPKSWPHGGWRIGLKVIFLFDSETSQYPSGFRPEEGALFVGLHGKYPSSCHIILRCLPPTDRVWEQYTHKNSTYRVAQHDHISSRVAQKLKRQNCTSLFPETIVINVSCLIPCRTWHWPQAQVLSYPFHPLLLSFRRSDLHTQALWFSTHALRRSTAEWRINKKCHLSHVEPKSVESKAIETEATEPKDRIPEELSLKGNLGRIRFLDMRNYYWKYGRIWKSWCRDAFR